MNPPELENLIDAFLSEKHIHKLSPGWSGSRVEETVREAMIRAFELGTTYKPLAELSRPPGIAQPITVDHIRKLFQHDDSTR